jgi:hypothetical protein
MDYIDTLLIMEDDLDENQEDGEFGKSSMTHLSKTHPGNPQGIPQIIVLLIHQIGVFVVDVDQCPRKSKTSAAN